MKIEDIIKSLGTAVQEAHTAVLDKSAEQFFAKHFDITESNSLNTVYKPRTIEIALNNDPDGSSSKIIYVPTAVLVSHSALLIDEVKVNFNIDISEESDGMNAQVQGNAASANTGSMEIVFKRTDEAEGLARIETQLNGML